MRTRDFAEFAHRMEMQGRNTNSEPAPALQRVAVLGGGPEGRMYAALALADGRNVTLFTAYGSEFETLQQAGTIAISGDGPVGNYHVHNERTPSIRITAALDKAIAGADLLILTGPLHKQRTYAMVLADLLAHGQVVLLPHARTFGGFETAWLLECGGCRADYTLVEASHSPYWIKLINGGLQLSVRQPPLVATIPGRGEVAVSGLAGIFPQTRLMSSALHSAMQDCSGAVELPALTLGGPLAPPGGPTIPEDGIPIDENNVFNALLGEVHVNVCTRLLAERRRVAAAWGVRQLPDSAEAITLIAGSARGAGARPIPDSLEAHEIVRAAIAGSLIPLRSAAQRAGISVPATSAAITIGSAALGRSMSGAGRTLENIGIDPATFDDSRRMFERRTNGAQTLNNGQTGSG